MPQYSEMFGVEYALYDMACVYSITGEKEKAVAALEKAIRKGYGNYKWLCQDKDLDNIRNEEGFKKLAEELLTVEKRWGYFSHKDGELHRFDICEECYDTWIASFQIPVYGEQELEC